MCVCVCVCVYACVRACMSILAPPKRCSGCVLSIKHACAFHWKNWLCMWTCIRTGLSERFIITKKLQCACVCVCVRVCVPVHLPVYVWESGGCLPEHFSMTRKRLPRSYFYAYVCINTCTEEVSCVSADWKVLCDWKRQVCVHFLRGSAGLTEAPLLHSLVWTGNPVISTGTCECLHVHMNMQHTCTCICVRRCTYTEIHKHLHSYACTECNYEYMRRCTHTWIHLLARISARRDDWKHILLS